MKFNNTGPTKEFDKKSRLPLYLMAVVIAAILGFMLLLGFNLLAFVLAFLFKHWVYTAVGVLILLIIKIKRRKKKKK